MLKRAQNFCFPLTIHNELKCIEQNISSSIRQQKKSRKLLRIPSCRTVFLISLYKRERIQFVKLKWSHVLFTFVVTFYFHWESAYLFVSFYSFILVDAVSFQFGWYIRLIFFEMDILFCSVLPYHLSLCPLLPVVSMGLFLSDLCSTIRFSWTNKWIVNQMTVTKTNSISNGIPMFVCIICIDLRHSFVSIEVALMKMNKYLGHRPLI